MIDPKTAFDGAAAGLGLLERLLKLLKSADKDGKHIKIADALKHMPAQGFELAGEIGDKVRALKQSFAKADIDDTRTLRQLQADTWWWRRKKYKLVQRFSYDVNALNDAIGQLLEDYVALAECTGEQELIASTFKEAQDMATQLSAFVRSEAPVKEIFERLTKAADEIRASLGDMRK